MHDSPTGHLFVVATPIGNLSDISLRALDTLRAVDAIAAEDTRRTLKLLSHHAIPRPGVFFSCHDKNERRAVHRILGLLRDGRDVALLSDAGMPLVNDPGFVVLREVRAAGHPIEILPGPSAVLTALVVSGLPVHSFTFKGFPPRKQGRRRRFFEDELQSPHTLVFFEAPMRLPKVLAVAADVLGPRPAAVCLELTKRFERVERGTLVALADRLADVGEKGEATVVIEGAGVRRSATGGDP